MSSIPQIQYIGPGPSFGVVDDNRYLSDPAGWSNDLPPLPLLCLISDLISLKFEVVLLEQIKGVWSRKKIR